MKRGRRARSERGAVLAEFAIAVVPLLATFFAFFQVTKLQTAKLVLAHASVVGVRTAIVTSNAKGNNPGVPADNRMPERAVLATLDPWIAAKSFSDVDIEVEDDSSHKDPSGPVTVTVRASVTCAVPMMGRVICKGPQKRLAASATMPHQGARYLLDSER